MNGTKVATVIAVIIAIIAVLAAASVVEADETPTTVSITSSEGTDTETDSVLEWISASGTCGTSGATWTVTKSSGQLSISGSGAVTVLNYSTNATWSNCGWSISSIDVGENDITSSASSDLNPSDVFSVVKSISINNSGTVAAKAFNSLSGATSVSFGSSHTSVEKGLFEDNTKITSVSFNNVKAVGDNAFDGCTALKSVDIASVTDLSHTAFKDCTALTEIKVESSNTAFVTDSNGLLLNKGQTEVYMAPTGMKKDITSVPSTVRTINLDYADVNYIINLDSLTAMDVTFVEHEGANAIGVAYSMQSISNTPTAKIDGMTFTLTFTLYKGWTSDGTIAVVDGGTVSTASDTSLTFSVSPGDGYKVYPVGKASITRDDLMSISDDGLNGWKVGSVDLNANIDAHGRVTVINSYTCAINGYIGEGRAQLGTEINNGGAECHVTSVQMGDYSSIETLYIDGSEGELTISEGVFQNLPDLVSVWLDDVSEVSEQMFRYCMDLNLVELTNCAEIGDYAFEGCTNLDIIRITFDSASPKLTIGDGAFSNSSVAIVHTDSDADVTGDLDDILVVYCDEFVNLSINGNNLVMQYPTYHTYTYASTATDKGQSGQFYRGGMASVYVGDMGQIYLTMSETGTASTQCLIVLDSQLGFEVDSLVVDSGEKLADLPTLSRDGYIFLGWEDENGTEVNSESTASTSMVIEAQWQKENTPDNTPTYILVLFVIAIVATVAVLFVNSRR